MAITFDLAPGHDAIGLSWIFGTDEYRAGSPDVFAVYLHGENLAVDGHGGPVTVAST